MKRSVYMVLYVLIALVPLGLLTDSPAWGEWEDLHYMQVLGFLPKGIADAKHLEPIIPDYSIAGLGETASYYLSALVGLLLIYTFYFIVGKLIGSKEDDAS